ncbi:MAG TPA: pyridoxine 5'-phosphate synthase [Candidatus Binataceae bacterium]|nr:pyridoxine 5'-phosphate synthase [Candidatus Binataceae bacterium]
MIKLGVNVDHVATLRQARRTNYPDPLQAALLAQRAGADAITIHLREDRRHIQDHDLFRIAQALSLPLNQELAPTGEMVELALKLHPAEVCLVPERREELTTEGGLDAAAMSERLAPIVRSLNEAKIGVSLFVEPDRVQLQAARELGAKYVELHTGRYAELADRDLSSGAGSKRESSFSEQTRAELARVAQAIKIARALGLRVNAGHGLNYDNTAPIAALRGLQWLHIGHAIVARAVMVGMPAAVRGMKRLIAAAGQHA